MGIFWALHRLTVHPGTVCDWPVLGPRQPALNLNADIRVIALGFGERTSVAFTASSCFYRRAITRNHM